MYLLQSYSSHIIRLPTVDQLTISSFPKPGVKCLRNSSVPHFGQGKYVKAYDG